MDLSLRAISHDLWCSPIVRGLSLLCTCQEHCPACRSAWGQAVRQSARSRRAQPSQTVCPLSECVTEPVGALHHALFDTKQHTEQLLAVAALAEGKADKHLCQTSALPMDRSPPIM